MLDKKHCGEQGFCQQRQPFPSQKTNHKILIQHLNLHWKACIVTIDFSHSWGRGETGKTMDGALKNMGTAQHPNWARNYRANLWYIYTVYDAN